MNSHTALLQKRWGRLVLPVFLGAIIIALLALPAAPFNGAFTGTAFGYGAVIEPEPTPPGTTDVSDATDSQGVFTEEVTAVSDDNLLSATIEQNTVGQTAEGEPLGNITITQMTAPPAPPTDTTVIGLTYDLGPDGATFDPPLDLSFSFDASLIPAGADPASMRVAYWDGSEWVVLPNQTIDMVTGEIRVPVSHFTEFQIISYTAAAAFSASNLTVSPTSIEAGDMVTLSVTITNTGDLSGSYRVEFRIGNVIHHQRITLAGGTSQDVTVEVREGFVGENTVTVADKSATYTIVDTPVVTPTPPAPTPTPPAPNPTPAPPAPAPAPSPAPAPPPAPEPEPTNWLLFGIAIAAVVVGAGFVLWYGRRLI